MKRKILSLLLAAALAMSATPIYAETTQADANTLDTDSADVIVFAHFTDDTQESADTWFNSNYASIKSYFVGDSNRSMVNYLNTVSYGNWDVNVYFPQENAEGTVTSIALGISQEAAKSGNQDAQILYAVSQAMPQLQSSIVDRNGDGYIDNLTIICKAEDCGAVVSGASLVCHSNSVYQSMGTLKYASYNILNTESLMQNESGVVIHEYLHTLGYPDLYRTDGSSDLPVYIWDIMGAVSAYPSYPLAFLRAKITNWLTIDTIKADGCYTLNAQSASTGNRAFIIKSPLRDTEYFVVEYRKAGRETGLDSLDRMIQGSGIIVYRVNETTENYTNKTGTPGIYVFRPQDTTQTTYTNVINAYLSAESGRTAIGSADLDAAETDGTLVFSDGSNSGIVIRNVGSAAGSTISFEVEFPDLSGSDLWEDSSFPSVGSGVDHDITIAEAGGKLYAAEYTTKNSTSGFTLYQQDGDSWEEAIGCLAAPDFANAMKLVQLDGSLYLAYIDYSNGLILLKADLQNKKWVSAAAIANTGYYFDICEADGKLYLSYNSGDMGEKANLAYYDGTAGTGFTNIGTYYTASFTVGRQNVVTYDGDVCVFVRDINNTICGFRYAGGKFTKITDDSIQAADFDVLTAGTDIYMSYVLPSASTLSMGVYDGAGWTTASSAINTSEAVLANVNDNMYVIASPASGDDSFKMYAYTNGGLEQEGDTVIDAASRNFTVVGQGSRIYISYVRTSDNKAFIKYKQAANQQGDDPDHDMEHHSAVEATCTTAGNSEYWYCKTCKKYFSDEAGTNEIAKDSWVIKKLGHSMEHHAAVAATCTTAGNSEYWYCTTCKKYFSDAAGTNEIAKDSWVIPKLNHDYTGVKPVFNWDGYKCTSATFKCTGCSHTETAAVYVTSEITTQPGCETTGVRTYTASCTFLSNTFTETKTEVVKAAGHSMEHHAAVAATCTTAGNSEYWYCKTCKKYFSDAAGTNEIAKDSWVIKKLGHSMEHHSAVAATCTTAGNSEYWYCTTCKKYFSGTAGTTEIAKDSWVIKKLGHSMEHHAAVAATCTTAGNSEYWYCTTCKKYFSDEAGTSEIAKDSWVIKKLGHSMEHHAAASATCTTAGNSEYWYCKTCKKYFSGTAGTTEIAKDSWVIPKLVAVTSVKLDKTSVSVGTSVTEINEKNGNPVKNADKSLAITKASQIQLTATVSPANAANKSLTWASSDETIATVDANGLVTVLRYGKATITATAADGSGADAACTVQGRFYDVNGSATRSAADGSTNADYQYFYNPVYWAADNGITTGYDYVYFGTDRNCSRRELMIFLWRLAGKPGVSEYTSASTPYVDPYTAFSDMGGYGKSTATYQAVAWGVTVGITKGFGDGTFKPDANITRKDTMIMIYRAAGKPKWNWNSSRTEKDFNNKYCSDVKNICKPGTDTYNSIAWAYTNKITNGYSSGEYARQFGCYLSILRKDIVTFLYRYKTL